MYLWLTRTLVKELRWVVNSLRRGCFYQREHDSLIQENPLVVAGDTNVCIGPSSTMPVPRPTGKRSDGKLSRFVWRGAVGDTGKAVRWPPTLLV